MKNLIWVIAWLGVGLWTAIAALGYWIIGAVTGLAANNADKVGGDAETVELINWLALLVQNVGEVAAVIVWAVVALAILGVAWIITKVAGRSSQAQPPVGS
ncbi:MAG: hypothetical protein AB7F09_06115 [Parvibaculaceae bacterium]